MRINYAAVLEFRKVAINIDDLSQLHIGEIKIKNGKNFLNIYKYSILGNNIEILLKTSINIKYNCFVVYGKLNYKANYSPLFKNEDFNRKYSYNGTLGCNYSREKTTFKVWSPAAKNITLLLYKNGDPSIKETPIRVSMKEKHGVWKTSINKNLKNYFYTYQVKVYDKINETIDPYATACGINGFRGAIIDFDDTNPKDWKYDKSPKLNNYINSIIYEANIRDISMGKDSGIKNKGKFLGLTESNSCLKDNISTGLSHIKELGITHLQLMPLFDFPCKSIDESNLKNYSWEYNTQNHNIPEGSYCTNPYDPICRIKELKEMIKILHKNDICVNLDVVYSHLWNKINNSFEKIFPGYYLRFNIYGEFVNGSGYGCDTSSENFMTKKFIVDSITFIAKEYHIDGFRFDLMGLHDVYTMNIIEKSISKFKRKIMLYGEGYDMNTSLPQDLKASKFNSRVTPKVSYFNDDTRNSIRGNIFYPESKGFIECGENLENDIKRCVCGSIEYNNQIKGIFKTPEQSINYVSCHDTHTLWDKLQISSKNSSLEDKKSMLKLANGIILTSQGIPFLHSGIEFCRSKNGISNSYNAPDSINSLNWTKKEEFIDVFLYCKGLIKLRKDHPAFRMNSSENIKNHLLFINNVPKNVVAFIIKDHANKDKWKDILVIYNSNKFHVTIDTPFKDWYLSMDKFRIYGYDLKDKKINNNKITVDGISFNVLYRK